MNNGDVDGIVEAQQILRHHSHQPRENQCTSALVKHIKAPVNLVWSLVRRFDQPQRYKPFVSRCVMNGELGIGSVREVNVKSGLPATTSTERLELLDDEEHILGVKFVGGDHRLKNYSSVITVHPKVIDGRPGTLVLESFVVDVPEGNTKDETCYFVKALIKCNLKSLADISERMALQDWVEPSIDSEELDAGCAMNSIWMAVSLDRSYSRGIVEIGEGSPSLSPEVLHALLDFAAAAFFFFVMSWLSGCFCFVCFAPQRPRWGSRSPSFSI
ncbi:LOW QUALITY PROTEIN: abscisic acid receptor PYL9 [Euphorbia lathyris]|uniref:LOW QUALITY PROTEIN: abscisic acid receptor PYL9 n=1 Tax=Euphorbia lathyris TaxID=212925 RepID=UPI0033144C0F